jgi:hypothetical protein
MTRENESLPLPISLLLENQLRIVQGLTEQDKAMRRSAKAAGLGDFYTKTGCKFPGGGVTFNRAPNGTVEVSLKVGNRPPLKVDTNG